MDMQAVMQALNDSVPKSPNQYLGDDGLLHCSVCGDAIEKDICFLGAYNRVRCICSCIVKQQEAEKERMRQQWIEENRRICFPIKSMYEWNFGNDEKPNAQISDAMRNYADSFKEFSKDGRGLLLTGQVGTGKTFYSSCIANKLIDDGYRVIMTSFSRLANQIQSAYEGKQEVIDDLNKYDLVVIDDLGAERNSEYMKEIVYSVIDARYCSGKPFIITTNLTIAEIKKPVDVTCSRIYDRIIERCFPIVFEGTSLRRKSVRDYYETMKSKLGFKG